MADAKTTPRDETALPSTPDGAASIAGQLRRAILDGTYGYRERLPAERDLAAHFGASRSTVREALKQLEENQLVSRKIGSGTFVLFRGDEEDGHIAEQTSPLELIDVRLAVEPDIARLAAVNASGRDLARLADALRQVEACKRDAEAFSRADEHFHLLLAECTRNPLMVWIYRHLNDVRSHAQWDRMKDKVLTEERVADYNQQHHQLYDALAARDADGAVRIITEHLEKARRDLMGVSAT